MSTIFEVLIMLVANSGLSDSMIHYFESKFWFEKYKCQIKDIKSDPFNTPYYKIPYSIWKEKTLINYKHISVLSKLIQGGFIVFDEANSDVIISPNDIRTFQSKKPTDYIRNICENKKNAFYLTRYLDEFYYSDFQSYRYENYDNFYLIDYSDWMKYIGVNFVEIGYLKRFINRGKFEVKYDDKNEPVKVLISAYN
jgi:hypothetical protein